MKKKLLFFFITFLFHTAYVSGQSRIGNWCGHDQRMQQELKNNPIAQQEYEKWRNNVREAVSRVELEKTYSGTVQIIPVVVHVIHDNGKGNISDAQAKDGIRVLNEDFMRQNADTSNTRVIFKPYAGVAEFEFRLATIDPNGNPTNGIVRKNSPLTYEADDNTKTVSYWNSSKYFNIWLVNSISGSSGSSTILGYAQFPGWGNWNKYGVIMLHTQFGRFGTSSSEGRTASHEVGHCLNLYHTFQSGCGGSNCSSDGDDVCDTPPVDQSTWGCSFTQNQCSNDASGTNSPFATDVVDQIENYLSYDDCQNMFTNDQIVRMKAAIVANTPLQNLVSSSNHAVTGINSLLASDFYSKKNVVCVNSAIDFIDFSYYGQTSWSWNFPGGSPSTSTAQFPSVTYSTPGLYDVSLAVTDGSVTKTKTLQNYILVVSTDGNFLPLAESFESITIPNSKWYISNPDNDSNYFQPVSGIAYSGNSSIMLDNSGNSSGKQDELIVGSFDFSNRSAVSISFKTAYAQKDTSTKDKMMVYISTDCGTTWSPRYAKTGNTLSSVSPQTSPFYPTGTSQWSSHTASLSASMMRENVMIKFVFESDEGNNFFLDDINITGTYKSPVLKLPYNNSTGNPDSAKVDWMPLSGTTFYQHQLDTSSGFNSPILFTHLHNFISNDPDSADTEHQFSNLLPGKKYFWRVRSIIGADTTVWSAAWNFTVAYITGEITLPNQKNSFVKLHPNPLEETSIISLSVAEKTKVSLSILDITGRMIYSIADDKAIVKGEHLFSISDKNLPPGLYFLKLTLNGQDSALKFIVE